MAISRLMRDAEKKKLTEQDVLLSPEMEDYLSMKAGAMHKDFHNPKIPTHVFYDPSHGGVAWTDNSAYTLNAGHELVSGTLNEKLNILLGLQMHETGHRLFTSFSKLKHYMVQFEQGDFYPGKPKMSRVYEGDLAELTTFMQNADDVKILLPIVKVLINLFEDGRIENFLLGYSDTYYTLAEGLTYLRGIMYEQMEGYPALKKSLEDGKKLRYEVFSQILLHYVRFGEIKDFDISMKDDEVIKIFDRIQQHADKCVESFTSMEFYQSFNQILVLLWPAIKEYVEQIKEQMEQEKEQEDSESQEGAGAGGSSSSPQNEEDGEGSDSSGASGGAGSGGTTHAPMPSAQEIAERIAERLGQLEGQSPDSSEGLSGAGSDSADTAEILQMDFGDSSQDGEPSGMAPPYTRTCSISGSGKGTITYRKVKLDESNTTIDLNKIKNSIAETRVDDELERQMKEDLRNFTKTIDFTKAHRGIDCILTRPEVSPYCREKYKEVSPALTKIAKNLAKKTDFFSEEDSPKLVQNQYYGKKINSASIAKTDLRHFSKKIYLEEAPSVAVAVLIDESGSMSGERARSAKAMAITIHKYCELMGIPVAIYGHTTTSGRREAVELFVYADFEKPDENDCYRLMNISSRSSNRDGYALRFLKARLEEQEADSKLLIIVSDGSPAANGYYGTAANEDLADIAQSCDKEGIAFVAAAIGSDKGQIRAIYGEKHFLDITDLSKLPVVLASRIRRLLK